MEIDLILVIFFFVLNMSVVVKSFLVHFILLRHLFFREALFFKPFFQFKSSCQIFYLLILNLLIIAIVLNVLIFGEKVVKFMCFILELFPLEFTYDFPSIYYF